MRREYPYVTVKGIYRPVINVEFPFPKNLATSFRSIKFKGLVDSGAFFTLFPAWIAETLGHSIVRGTTYDFQIAGRRVKAHRHRVVVGIGQAEQGTIASAYGAMPTIS